MTPLDRASGRFEVLADMMVLVHQQADSRCGLCGQVGVGPDDECSCTSPTFVQVIAYARCHRALLGIRGPSNSGRCSQSPRSNGASTPDAALVLRAGRAGRSQRRRFSRAGSRRTGSGAGRALGRQGDHAGVADLASASAAMRSPARSWPGESYPLVTCFCPGAKSDRGQRRRVGQTLCVRRRLAGGRCRDQHGRSLGTRGSVRRTAGRTESRDWWFPAVPGEPLRMRARSPSRSRPTPAGPFHCWIVSALDHLEPSPNSATADASRPSSHVRSD
jgi:hypothetical protein